MIPLDTVQLETFAPLVGRSFVTGEVRLELSEVRTLGHKRPDAPRDPFALTFRGPQGLRLPQGIHHFECEGLGAIEFFITQTGDGAKGSEFEAIFT
jgi:hypothetical protein